jgi:hypothetical protein
MRPQFIHKFERLGCLTPGTTSGVPEDRGGDDVKASGTYFAWALGPPGLAAVAFAPSSPETPDAFRLSEALEAGCIPIADCRVLASKDNTDFGDDYWTWFFGEEPPFPVLSDYKQLHGYTGEANHWLTRRSPGGCAKRARWPPGSKATCSLSGAPDTEKLDIADLITVLIPSSPIAAHPDRR